MPWWIRAFIVSRTWSGRSRSSHSTQRMPRKSPMPIRHQASVSGSSGATSPAPVAAQLVPQLGHQLAEDRPLVAEVDVEGALRHAGASGDLHDRGALVALGA